MVKFEIEADEKYIWITCFLSKNCKMKIHWDILSFFRYPLDNKQEMSKIILNILIIKTVIATYEFKIMFAKQNNEKLLKTIRTDLLPMIHIKLIQKAGI